MKAIPSMTKEEYEEQRKVLEALNEKTAGHMPGELLDLGKKMGYAHYTFSGEIRPLLIQLLGRYPTSGEIIMLVDGGLGHFGATCAVNGNKFSGRVNTD